MRTLVDGATFFEGPGRPLRARRGGWPRHRRGPRPGRPHGGVLQLPANQQVWVTMTLELGRYLLLCTVNDPKGRPHDQLGMLSVLEVSAR